MNYLDNEIDFAIKRYPLGVAIIARSIPANDVSSIMEFACKGLRNAHMFPGIARAIGAWAVVATPENGQKWRDELSKKEDWLKSGDTGISSETIHWVLHGGFYLAHFGIPYDPDDFGRCYRLLKRFPEYRARLPEVAEKFPAWEPLVREWDRMTEIYERDLPTGKSEELFKLIQELTRPGK